MTGIVRLVSMAVLLSLVGVFLVNILSFGHQGHRGAPSHTAAASHHSDCPFMHHGESICPMTTLDHISVLRALFESSLPTFVTLVIVLGSTALVALVFLRRRPLSLLHAHAILRWRQTVTYSFVFRFYQSLLARGIIQPKVFA